MNNHPNIHKRRSIRLQGYDYTQSGLYFITLCCHNKELRFGTISNDGDDARMIFNDFGEVAYNEWLKLPERFPGVQLDTFQIMPNHMHGIIVINKDESNAKENVGATLAVAQLNMGENISGPVPDVRATARVAPTDHASILNVGDVNNLENVGATLAVALRNTDKRDWKQFQEGTNKNVATSNLPIRIGDIVGAYKSIVTNKYLALHRQRSTSEYMGKIWQRNYYEHVIRNDKSYYYISSYILANPQQWQQDRFYILNPTNK